MIPHNQLSRAAKKDTPFALYSDTQFDQVSSATPSPSPPGSMHSIHTRR